jgi:3-polyprenyl-4-hydroxybenzoate decarboxylase
VAANQSWRRGRLHHGQHGWNFIQHAKQRGAPSVAAAVVIGVGPITFAIGTSKITALGEEEGP